MRQLLQMMKRRRSSWSEALIVAPGCDTVTIGQIGGTRLHTLNMRATDLQSGSESVAQLVSHIRHLHPRARRALLLLPRNQYAFKRFELPPCESKHLSEVMRNQLELRSSFGADRAYFDYVSISEHLQSASKQQMYGMYIAPRPLIDGWRVALNEAGLSLDQVTTQTQIAAETFGAKAASSGVLSVVSNNSGIELIYAWEGAVCATGFIESLPGENPNIVQLGAETARMRASLSAPMVVEEIHVVGDRDEAIAAVLIKMFPGLPVSASQSRATVGSNDGNSSAPVFCRCRGGG